MQLLDSPLMYDEPSSFNQDGEREGCRSLYVKYLEAAVEILSFMHEDELRDDYLALLSRSSNLLKEGRGGVEILSFLRSGDKSSEDSLLANAASLLSSISSLDEKELESVAKKFETKKNEGGDKKDGQQGVSGGLMHLVAGKNKQDAEAIKQAVESYEGLCEFIKYRKEDKVKGLLSSEFLQKLGVTKASLGKLHLLQIKSNSEETKKTHTNQFARKLCLNVGKGAEHMPNFFWAACKVRGVLLKGVQLEV